MTNAVDPTVETSTSDASRAWTYPVCTEYALDELTQAGGPGLTDAGTLS
jgi:surface antigen